jgi:hypothetical protein
MQDIFRGIWTQRISPLLALAIAGLLLAGIAAADVTTQYWEDVVAVASTAAPWPLSGCRLDVLPYAGRAPAAL